MKEPKIHGLESLLPELPEGHGFLLEGEPRRGGLKYWSRGDNTWVSPEPCPHGWTLEHTDIYCAPIRKSYAERQAEWVAEHGIKVGSKVVVIRDAKDHEDGWPLCWMHSMDKTVGTTLTVDHIEDRGISLDYLPMYPYFVLEPIQDIAPGHNPDGLTVDQVGEGYRLMTLEEVDDKSFPFAGKCSVWERYTLKWGPEHGSGCSRLVTYRVRKEPKLVPLTAEDWAGEGCWWVRQVNDSGKPYARMVVGLTHLGVVRLFDDVEFSPSKLMEYAYERSRDLINWEPCSKPE